MLFMIRDATLLNFWGVSEIALRDILVFDGSSPMVLRLADCLAEVHFATISTLRNGKIFQVGGDSL